MTLHRLSHAPTSPLLLLLALALAGTPACAPPEPAAPELADAALFSRLESEIPELMVHGDVPGLSIAVLDHGETVWSGAFGVRGPEGGGPVGRQTVFPAASLSKPVLAYVVLRLVERGLLDLDRPLWELLPYPRLEHDPRARAITPRRVLTHTPGLPNWGGTPLEMIGEPGGRFSYSGEGFVYLQKTVEEVTGKPLEQLAREEVFEPLGMARSSFVWEEAFAGDAVVGTAESGEPQPIPKSGGANAAASLLTTAEDYARFLAALLTGEGLSPESKKAMLERQVEADRGDPPPAEGAIFWGLGWGLQRAEGEGPDLFWHWGDNGGFKCYTAVDPARGAGLVYFTNSHDGLSIAAELAGRILGGDHPALLWAGYESFDAPERLLRKTLEKAFVEAGVEAGLASLKEARETSPEIAGERFLNELGYFLLSKRKLPEAVAVFRRNTELYPDSGNVHDSLGEALLSAGEEEASAASYRRSLELDPDNHNAERYLAWIEEAAAARARPPEPPSPATLETLAGAYGEFRVRFGEGTLGVGHPHFGEELRLEPMTEDTFAAVGRPEVRLRFEPAAEGRPGKLFLLLAGGRVLEAERAP